MNKLIFTLILGLSISAQAQQTCFDLFSSQKSYSSNEIDEVIRELRDLKYYSLNADFETSRRLAKNEFERKFKELSQIIPEAEIKSKIKAITIPFDKKTGKAQAPSTDPTLLKIVSPPRQTGEIAVKAPLVGGSVLVSGNLNYLLPHSSSQRLKKFFIYDVRNQENVEVPLAGKTNGMISEKIGAFSSNETYAYFITSAGLELFHLGLRRVITLGDLYDIRDVKFSHNDKMVAVTHIHSNRETVTLIDLESKKTKSMEVSSVEGLMFIPEKNLLFVLKPFGGKLYDMNFREVKSMVIPTGRYSFVSDGNIIGYKVSLSKKFLAFDIETQKQVVDYNLKIDGLTDLYTEVITQDGKFSLHIKLGSLYINQTTTDRVVHEFKGISASGVALSNNGKDFITLHPKSNDEITIQKWSWE